MRLAVVRICVLCHTHQPLARQRCRRRSRRRMDVGRQIVTVVLAAELDGALCGLFEREIPGRIRVAGRRGRRRRDSRRAGRRDPWRRSPAASAWRPWLPRDSIATSRASVWLPSDVHVHGRFLLVSPQMTSTLSHGMSSTSAATRAVSMTECVPRLPTPDCTYSLPSGRIVIRPS